MRPARLWIFCLAVSLLVVVNFSYAEKKDKGPNTDPEGRETIAKPLTEKQKRKREEKLRKELETPYRKWLNEDVTYIITDEERTAWKRLSTDEEREQFIEQFWLRRDPTPDTVENEFKEEHYRRIAYANEHYASGIPGWKADRGRIYITFGPPDEIESHPSGGSYQRPMEEGGGETSTYPFEQWRYRYIEGIGNDIIIEFVDPTMTGEYRMTMDPSEKDALLYVPNAGLTMMEQMGMASKTDRFNRTDGTHLGQSLGGTPASMNEFERLERFSKLQKPPAVKFKDLEAAVSSHITFNLLPVKVQTDYIKVTNSSVLTNITILMQNKDLQFQLKDGVQKAVVNIYARITTMSRRVVNVFEDTVTVDSPKELLQAAIVKPSLYQKSVPLRSGLYRLDLVIKDTHSGNVGTLGTALRVPRFEEDKLDASSLILADQIEPAASAQIGAGEFVLGAYKVRPRLSQEFSASDKLGIYLQLYNLKVDEATHKTKVSVAYRVTQTKDQKEVWRAVESADHLHQGGEQLTIERLIPVNTLPPGRYTIEVTAIDLLTNETVIRSTEFMVRPAPAKALVPLRPSLF